MTLLLVYAMIGCVLAEGHEYMRKEPICNLWLAQWIVAWPLFVVCCAVLIAVDWIDGEFDHDNTGGSV